MSKIDQALDRIQAIEDSTERALLLGGLISTLLKIKGIIPVIVGELAVDCYTNAIHNTDELILSIHTGKITPRIFQDVFVEQLHGEGIVWKWRIANVLVKISGEVLTEHKELCRDFQTDFGIVKLIPAEELTAERVLAAFYPHPNEAARVEAKRLI